MIDEHLFATGDDSGELKVWDLRKGTSIMEMKQHEEYISDMAVDGNKKLLLTTRYCSAVNHMGHLLITWRQGLFLLDYGDPLTAPSVEGQVC